MTRDWWDREFRVMFALGDSITAGGWSSCRERRWTDLLARLIGELQRVPVQLVNVGIGANVLSARSAAYEHSSKPVVSERIGQHVLDYHANGQQLVPDLLLIACCLNDARGGTPVGVYCEELADIVWRVRERIQPLIVLVGPYHMTDFALGGPDWSHADAGTLREYNAAMRVLAERLDCLFVDLLAACGDADWMVHHDGVHANDLGHRIVANEVFRVLASSCSGLALETRELEGETIPWRDESTLQVG